MGAIPVALMTEDSKGRFERYECTRCGAHLRVTDPGRVAGRCAVCGAGELVRIRERPPRRLARPAGDEPDRPERG